MACSSTQAADELEFVRAVLSRNPKRGECRGPLLTVAFWPYRIFVLEHIFDSKVASEILWDGYREDDRMGVQFALCGAHWLDLAALCALRASQYRRPGWATEAVSLMEDVCTAAGWDSKEISNMFAWQLERLT